MPDFAPKSFAIRTLSLTLTGSGLWRETLAKVLIPIDRGEGGGGGSAPRFSPVLQERSDILPFILRNADSLLILNRDSLTIFRNILRIALACVLAILAADVARAQGGPPYYTNDPGTPGKMNWEINFGYMPFLYNGQSTTHTPDVDINFGPNDRVQLTYESAWLRVKLPGDKAKYGMEQDQLGVKWRFYDKGDEGGAFSIFPQLSVNNPNDAVRRGIAPPGDSLILPVEFTRKFGPVDINVEGGYNIIQHGPNGWLTGLVVGRQITKRLELDSEFYATGTFHPSYAQPTIDVGARYRMHRPFILLLMAGRGVEPARSNQPYFVGYFGVQILLPKRAFEKEEEDVHPEETNPPPAKK